MGSWRAVVHRVSEKLPAGRRGQLWRLMNVAYERRHRRPLLKSTEPGGVDESVFRDARVTSSAGVLRFDPAQTPTAGRGAVMPVELTTEAGVLGVIYGPGGVTFEALSIDEALTRALSAPPLVLASLADLPPAARIDPLAR